MKPIEPGDKISQKDGSGSKTWKVRNVSDGYVELDSGEFVEIEEIERDIRHDRTRVFKQ